MDINSKIELKKLKKEFRRIQRRNMFIYEENKNKNIENLFKIKNKENFWKAFQSYKNKEDENNIDSDKNVVMEACFDHFYRLFHKNFEDHEFSDQQKEIIKKVDEYKSECKEKFNSNEKMYVNNHTLSECIKSMKSSNSVGYDGMSNNMIKMGMSDRLLYILKSFFNAILCTGIIPDNFNRTIIISIIKDKLKKAFDVNNLRPISVSNCLAQIFERIILINSKFLKDTSTNQFGFHIGLSTYQPIFLLKETVSKYKKVKSPLYIASLDAEKAYDS